MTEKNDFMKKLISSIVLTASIFTLSAQEIIQTDRPSASTGAYIVPVGRLQIETGALFGLNLDNGDNQYFRNDFNASLVRFGLSSSSEIRLEQGFTQQIIKGEDFESKAAGLTNLGLGGKFAILKQKGWIPPLTLIATVRLPYESSDVNSHYIYSDYILATQIKLFNKLGILLNYGGLWNGNNPNYLNFYALTIGYSVNERFSAFIEPYGTWDQINYINQSFNAGITYATLKKFQVDLIAGYENSGIKYFNVGGGISFCFF